VTAPQLEISEISKNFGGLKALDQVSLEVASETIVGIVGANGSGKSTLFNIASGFLKCDSGCVRLAGRPITGLRPHHIAQMGLARSFQVARAPDQMTVLENLLLAFADQRGETIAGALLGRRPIAVQENRNLARALEILALTNLAAHANALSSELSGGQRKLLSIARILARDASTVLLDEPAAGINPTLRGILADLVRRLKTDHGKTIVLIEHDMRFVGDVCDHVFVLDAGRLIAAGTPAEVRNNDIVLNAYLGRGPARLKAAP